MLTVEEAEAYRQKFVRRQAHEPSPSGLRHEYTFATMSDGVKTALAVGYPKDFDPSSRSRKHRSRNDYYRLEGPSGSGLAAMLARGLDDAIWQTRKSR